MEFFTWLWVSLSLLRVVSAFSTLDLSINAAIWSGSKSSFFSNSEACFISDSIFILITDEYENNVNAIYFGISKYYDNRDAVVTATADDWAGWVNDKFIETCRIFRNYNLWLSCAIVTNVGDPNTWIDIQTQIDSGFIEPISHSRTHPYVPYDDLQGEVIGFYNDYSNLKGACTFSSGCTQKLDQEFNGGEVDVYGFQLPFLEQIRNFKTYISIGHPDVFQLQFFYPRH